MKHRRFIANDTGISVMYDAVLFLAMVSLAGVLLLPALQSNITVQTSIETHREHLVDEALQTYLVSRENLFTYRLGGSLIDTVAAGIGINLSNSLYQSITSWILSHEQRHKTHAALLGEMLGCQFHLPSTFSGIDRLNFFTEEFNQNLCNETDQFFSDLFHEKYEYNLTAYWNPIKGVPFGGAFSSGQAPPASDTYVAHRSIIMPYAPGIRVGNQTIVITRHWLEEQLFGNNLFPEDSSIPLVANITRVIEWYLNNKTMPGAQEIATAAIQKNLSMLVQGFLVNGIKNETNETVFPGIVPLVVSYGFEMIQSIAGAYMEEALDAAFGDAIRGVDRLFTWLNETDHNPVSACILSYLNETFRILCNGSFPSLHAAVEATVTMIQDYITSFLEHILDAPLEAFATDIVLCVKSFEELKEMLLDWLCDRICLDTGNITLTIWVARQ